MRRGMVAAAFLGACGSVGGNPSPDAGGSGPPGHCGGAHARSEAAGTFGALTTAVVSDIAQAPLAWPTADPVRTYRLLAPRAFAIGDLNGDGRPDLFVAPSLADASAPDLPPQIWLGCGDGTFYDGTQEVTSGSLPMLRGAWPWLADFNGDGRLDVFISDVGANGSGGKNHLLLSGGDGRLHAADSMLPVDDDADASAWVGDVDGDGCPDVSVVASSISPRINGLYLLLGDCRGGFTKVVDALPAEIAEVALDDGQVGTDHRSPTSTTMVDLDGDGQVDVLGCWSASLVDPDPSGVGMYRNVHGTFVATGLMPTSHSTEPCTSLVAADLDGDGLPEILSLRDGTEGDVNIQVFHNEGGFAFSDVSSASVPSGTDLTNTGSVRAISLADVNGDGRPDLVCSQRSIGSHALTGDFSNGDDPNPFIFLNDGQGHLVPWTFGKDGRAATMDDLTAAGLPADLGGSIGLPLVFDADGDGVDDIVLVDDRQTFAASPHTPEVVRVYTVLAAPR